MGAVREGETTEQSVGMKFLPLGATFNALLGGLRRGQPPAPPTTFFSPRLLAWPTASREAARAARLENGILLTEQKHTLLTHSSLRLSSVAAFHFPTAEFSGRKIRPVASKAKRPLLAPLHLPKPIHLGMPKVVAKVGRCPQKTVFELCDGGQRRSSSFSFE